MLSALLGGLYLLADAMGTDLSAAVARADFAAAGGPAPVDFRWYGGTQQFGYSLGAQYLTDLLGARLTGVFASAVAALAFAALLGRLRVRRPFIGAVLGTLFIFGNLVSGRVTYAVGLALGLLALLALADERTRLAGMWAVLSSAASPVSGLFVGLVGVALLLSGRRRDGWVLALCAAAPLLLTAGLFGQGGYNTMSWRDASHAMVLSAGVGLLTRHQVVRVGAGLSLVGNLVAFSIHTPVGLNATRLAVVFAVPVLLATSRRGLVVSSVVGTLLVAYQPPVIRGDYESRGTPIADPDYSAPLAAELRRRVPGGRGEVPPTRHYWEAAHVASEHPLARGWLRQLDTGRNALFFDGSLSADSYRAWLEDNGVQYVAVAGVEPSWVGRAEAQLVRAGLPYLSEVWRHPDWVLYEVAGRPAVSSGAGTEVLELDATGVTVRVDRPGSYEVKVQHSRWLTLSGPAGCLAPQGRWTRLEARAAGTFRIGSRLQLRTDRC